VRELGDEIDNQSHGKAYEAKIWKIWQKKEKPKKTLMRKNLNKN